jgi:hypothetical protein
MPTPRKMPRLKYELPTKVLPLIALGYKIAAAATNNAALFVTPSPTPAAITTATQALEQANTVAKGGGKAATTARGLKQTALENLLHQWGGYLETIAATMPGQEAYVYESGGFAEKDRPTHVTEDIKLTQPGGPGTAHARCKAAPKGKKAFYGWRISLNGGQTWVISQTNDSHTDFTGIPSGTLIQVQFNVTMKNVTSAWSVSADLLVK